MQNSNVNCNENCNSLRATCKYSKACFTQQGFQKSDFKRHFGDLPRRHAAAREAPPYLLLPVDLFVSANEPTVLHCPKSLNSFLLQPLKVILLSALHSLSKTNICQQNTGTTHPSLSCLCHSTHQSLDSDVRIASLE